MTTEGDPLLALFIIALCAFAVWLLIRNTR